jgi:hypothetical protein
MNMAKASYRGRDSIRLLGGSNIMFELRTCDWLRLSALGCVLLAVTHTAAAQSFPSRPRPTDMQCDRPGIMARHEDRLWRASFAPPRTEDLARLFGLLSVASAKSFLARAAIRDGRCIYVGSELGRSLDHVASFFTASEGEAASRRTFRAFSTAVCKQAAEKYS